MAGEGLALASGVETQPLTPQRSPGLMAGEGGHTSAAHCPVELLPQRSPGLMAGEGKVWACARTTSPWSPQRSPGLMAGEGHELIRTHLEDQMAATEPRPDGRGGVRKSSWAMRWEVSPQRSPGLMAGEGTELGARLGERLARAATDRKSVV